MPKQRTKKSLVKRICNGAHRCSNRAHMSTHKSSSRMRRLRKNVALSDGDKRLYRKLLKVKDLK